MERNIDLNEISDGRFYTANDMVRQIVRDVKDVLSVVTEWASLFYWIH